MLPPIAGTRKRRRRAVRCSAMTAPHAAIAITARAMCTASLCKASGRKPAASAETGSNAQCTAHRRLAPIATQSAFARARRLITGLNIDIDGIYHEQQTALPSAGDRRRAVNGRRAIAQLTLEYTYIAGRKLIHTRRFQPACDARGLITL